MVTEEAKVRVDRGSDRLPGGRGPVSTALSPEMLSASEHHQICQQVFIWVCTKKVSLFRSSRFGGGGGEQHGGGRKIWCMGEDSSPATAFPEP